MATTTVLLQKDDYLEVHPGDQVTFEVGGDEIARLNFVDNRSPFAEGSPVEIHHARTLTVQSSHDVFNYNVEFQDQGIWMPKDRNPRRIIVDGPR